MILRQSLREHRSPFVRIGLLLLVPVALALIWYGAMLVALAIKVSPENVNAISGYRDAFDFLAGLEAADITGTVRLIVALAGLGAFLIFSFLAWKLLPRPYLARGELTLGQDERGTMTVEPRAVERAVEVAAREHPSVVDATARYGDDGVEVDVDIARARDLAETLREVQHGAREALRRHDLPEAPVSVTLSGLDRQRGRELE